MADAPSLRALFAEDARTALLKDPAARTSLEVVLTYPGVHALWAHRVANRMWRRGWLLPARILAAVARRHTGIEIHPAASIGRRLFIDHGMGVVVGETAVIGDDVTVFHGVTLGGTRAYAGRRHPHVGDRVVVGAGATVLGPIVVGDDARIGAGAVVLADVPARTTAVGVPARTIQPSTAPMPQSGGPQWEVDPAAWI
ncbi:MAG: serine O-acetyltransferase [Actinomycetales bacterium]|nr:serine O-acetyltransferase [Actinomycetales bacterium]